MCENKEPEIKKMSLGSLILKIKSLQISKIDKFPFLEKPNQKNLKDAVNNMKIIGCLDSN